MDYDSRKVWYLKNLFHCKKNNWPLITHEYLKTHFDKILSRVDQRFFEEFEMEPLNPAEFADVEQYFVPDAVFENIQNRYDSRTEMLNYLYTVNDADLEAHLRQIFDQILENSRRRKIQGIFHCLNAFKTLEEISNKYEAPLTSYVFSAVRKVHGYRETLYCANIGDGIFCSHQCENRYKSFTRENVTFPILERRELIALFGKPSTFPLIPLMDEEPLHEICICSEAYSPSPQIFLKATCIDQDLYYESKNLFPADRIINRQHPYKMDELKISRSEVKHDPASTILSSRRVASVSSQILLKAMLWNRVAVMKKKTLPFSFACERKMDSCKKVDLTFLNYYIFCYLTPSELMFSEDYWVWRMTSPAESEIYQTHLNYYFNKFNLPREYFYHPDSDNRFRLFLKGRGYGRRSIGNLLSFDRKRGFCYTNAVSKLRICYESTYSDFWCLNEFDGSVYVSRFSIDLESDPVGVFFAPLEDKSGYVRLLEVSTAEAVGSEEIDSHETSPYRYYPQNAGWAQLDFSFTGGNLTIALRWSFRTVHEQVTNDLEAE
jgi:hypothetical protein